MIRLKGFPVNAIFSLYNERQRCEYYILRAYVYIFEYRKRSHRDCRRLKQAEEENSFSNGVLEGRKGTKIKEMSTRDGLSLS